MRYILHEMGITVEFVGDASILQQQDRKCLRIVHPRALLDAFRRPALSKAIEKLKLVVCENLELLDAEYELAVSLLLHATQRQATRFVGLSTSLADPSGLAAWLRVPWQCMTCFRPSVREQDLRTTVQTFTIPYSAAFFKAMAKPAHTAISTGGGEFSLVFVPSRSQCRPVGNDLITRCAMDLKLQGYLPVNMSVEALEPYIMRLQDRSLSDFVTRGIGIYHDGLSRQDRALMLELCAEGIVRVLIVPREALWSVPLRAGVVVVLGTQYVRLAPGEKEDPAKRDRQITDYPLTDVVHMQGRAARHSHAGRFYLFCQAEGRETLTRFLEEGLPLESTLHESRVLGEWLGARWKDGSISQTDRQQTMDILSWTYLARRMESNPMYYDAVPGELDSSMSKVVDRLHSPEGCTS